MTEISFKKAAMYNAVAKYITMVVQLGLTMVLSRLIAPESFGVITIITVIIAFVNLFSDMGLGISIIQYPEMEKEEINKLYSFSCIVGVILMFITGILSFPLSAIYDESLYRILCPIASLASFFNAVNVVPNAILTRDKAFQTIAVRTVLCAIVSGSVAVVIAYFGYGVYALVLQTVISSIFLYIWNRMRISLSIVVFDWKSIMSVLGKYSLFQVLFNFLNYFTRNLDNLIIGKYFGVTDLAYYSRSYYLYLYPNNIFAAVITGVLHPYIREYKNDNHAMYVKYVQIIKLLSIIGIFTMTSFFVCSDEIIQILFGDNWLPAGKCLKYLSICMWAQMMGSVPASIFLGLGRTDQIFRIGIINFFLILISIIVGVVYNSIYLLSLCVGVSYNIIFVIANYILIKKTLKLSLRKIVKTIGIDCLYAFMFLGFSALLPELSSNLWLSLFYKLFIVFFSFILYLLVTKQMYVVLDLVKRK